MKKIPENMIHVSVLPEDEQAKISKNIKANLYYFSAQIYDASPKFKTGNVYGPFIKA